MIRKIITIHEELCNGCGLCVDACHEGAIELVNGVAKLVSDSYCDGFGDCLPECPTGAIEMIEREAEEYDDEAVQQRMAERRAAANGAHGHAGHTHAGHAHAHAHGHGHGHGGCPGSMAQLFRREESAAPTKSSAAAPAVDKARVAPGARVEVDEARPSELRQWPIQLHLVNPANSYFDGANLLVAADCTAFAYGDFHRDFIKNHITLIGCPKLDDVAHYADKLTEILRLHDIRSITVVRMVVPCCGGIVQAVKQAMLASQTIVPYREVTISLEGQLV
ncbi:4Fe-4S binding protein [Gorillibacterium sp. CAU 1737]|uniref:ATP-binding protein n=1 Tax=Gorillibacterium sp. CAU 1737 TaxID=3140362 RepID=UPI0032610588